jgi:hypothetical protein
VIFMEIYLNESSYFIFADSGYWDLFEMGSTFEVSHYLNLQKWNIADWWYEDLEDDFEGIGKVFYEKDTNDNGDLTFMPYPLFDLDSNVYYDVDPSRNFIRVFFDVDYLDHNNYKIYIV